MAKWLKLIDKDEWLNLELISRVLPMKNERPYLRLSMGEQKPVDIYGVDAKAICAYLAKQGVEIDLEKYVVGPPKWGMS